MQKVLRLLLKGLLGVVILLAIYCIAGLTLYRIPVNKNAPKVEKGILVFLKSNGVHTDMVMPVNNEFMDWRTMIKPADTGNADTTFYEYVGIGWGDKGFYLQTPEWKDLKASVALKAAFHLSTAAIHATFMHKPDSGYKCVPISVSVQDYQRMVNFIKKDFLLDAQSRPQHIVSTNDGYGDTDVFYDAKGSYSFFYTCNTWTNNVLKAGRQKAALWTLLDKGIFYHYQ